MLIQFRVENHRSLRDEQTLSMVAASVGDKDDARLIRPKGLDEALLPSVALYGANASGKSNVLSALEFVQTAVLQSHRLWEPEGRIPRQPFSLSNKAEAPSTFEVDILLAGVRYRYGFIVSNAAVEGEWLHAWPRGRKQVWFSREGDNFDFGKHLQGENDTIRQLTRPNSLFLSAAAQNNHALVTPIFRWLTDMRLDLHATSASSNRGQARTEQDIARALTRKLGEPKRLHDRDAVVWLLRAADTGILDYKIEWEESEPRFPGQRTGTTGRQLLYFRHKTDDGARAWLPFSAESDGTIRLLDVATRMLRALNVGGLVGVDELSASLHPMLALELLRLFHDPKHNPHGAQLVFATHDTNLLGNLARESPLRRDQIWFTEKDDSGATKLYPLTDFHPRKEENLERGYLQGRYGAIPFLGDLVAEPARPKDR